MTAQKIFDKIVTHLRTQNAVSATANGLCLYRSPDGKKCAVGCMIPDDVYDPDMEHHMAGSVIADCRQLHDLYDHRNLLESMQLVHDNHPISQWEAMFASIAAEYKLVYSAP